jgi:hypothetical protein
MPNRSPHAALSPAEINALRRIANGLANFLSADHLDVPTSMGLVSSTLAGHLVLTEAGKQRLAEANSAEPVRAQTLNPFDRLPGK